MRLIFQSRRHFLSSFFSYDCIGRIIVAFVPNQKVDVISRSEPANSGGPVLVNAAYEVAGDSDVECTMFAAGKNVRVIHDHTDWNYGFRARRSAGKLPALRGPGMTAYDFATGGNFKFRAVTATTISVRLLTFKARRMALT